jgi:hypothetical protein
MLFLCRITHNAEYFFKLLTVNIFKGGIRVVLLTIFILTVAKEKAASRCLLHLRGKGFLEVFT